MPEQLRVLDLFSGIRSAASASDLSEPECEPSPSVKSTRSAGECSPSTGPTCPATKTLEPSQATLFAETELPSISSAEGSHVKTSRALELALALLANGRGSGLNLPVSLASYDRASSSWKTWQRSLIETGQWASFSEPWPTSGMMRSGQLYPLAPWASHMCDSECSLWPTPTASMDGRGFGIPLHDRTGRYKKSTVSRVHALVRRHGWRIHPNFTEALMGFPMDHTAIEPLEIRSPPSSPNSSDAPS